MKEKNIKEELEGLSPFLANLYAKKEKVETPENYFSYLENSVMQQVELEVTPALPTTGETKISLWNRLFSSRGIMSFASVLLLVFSGFYLSQKQPLQGETALQFTDLTDAEILNYLTENVEDLDVYSLELATEETSTLDMIEFEEGETDYILEDVSTDIFIDEIL